MQAEQWQQRTAREEKKNKHTQTICIGAKNIIIGALKQKSEMSLNSIQKCALHQMKEEEERQSFNAFERKK